MYKKRKFNFQAFPFMLGSNSFASFNKILTLPSINIT